MTLALMGSSYGENRAYKSNLHASGTQQQNPTLLELIPAAFSSYSGKSPGNPVVKLAPPNGTNNLTEGTNKNELRVKGRSNPK
jgi:hypothetical protein